MSRNRFSGAALAGRQQGFSMIELVIVMVIIGLLSAMAFPSYQRYVARGNRAAAKAFLNDLAQRQSSFFADRKRFATTLEALGYGSKLTDTAFVDETGTVVAAQESGRTYYQVKLVKHPLANTGTTSVRSCTDMDAAPDATYNRVWAATAKPLGRQADNDRRCGTLCLNGTGRQGASGTTPAGGSLETDGWQNCWRG